ncbi:unnamed protein product [Nippostrongylus brasiliensis]|uniref:DM domain-containing protein n=1 Tax=Nippostrongylus brasiliensis TaxID=27835 RepID=A0A0N4YIK1_NIPBR|nr:unnamed protein product [Nippostrongylus brasiliensis]
MNVNDATTLKKATGECHRFFGYGKKIPRDVKRHCGMCRQHGIVIETRGHLCQFRNCECGKRTTIASEADVVPLNGSCHPESEKREDLNLCYFCQKCKNHGDHKRKCEFANCRCEQCDLIDTRRALDRHIKKSKDMKPGSVMPVKTLSFRKFFRLFVIELIRREQFK